MKKSAQILLLAAAVLQFTGVSGQKAKVKNDPAYDKKPLHFGFTVGLNAMDFGVLLSESAYLDTLLFTDVTALKPG